MKKIYLSTFLALGLSFSLLAQEQVKPLAPINMDAAKVSLAEISFEKDVHDFGVIEYSGNGTYEFKFKNTGKEPLIITNAAGSCGCTVPTWERAPIKPFASSVIKVAFDTKRTGPFQKTVTITSNAKTPQKVITIKGTVSPQITQETSPVKKEVSSPIRVN